MRFTVGYQLPEAGEMPFSELIAPYADSIREVYFPWMDIASGRSALATRHGYTDWKAQTRLEEDLRRIRGMGIRLDLLFNANCYGRLAMSEELKNNVGSILEHLQNAVGGVEVITTTSPFIAEVVKRYFSGIDVRASVNMWIGTVKAMQYLADLFDSFYVQREYNRDLAYIRELRSWCDQNGKHLYLLANSGCFSFCTGHSFHDNLVAHESEICETNNVRDFLPYTCWRYLNKRENWPVLLQNSWIRPEDVYHYESLIDTMKLATRMHAHPEMVIRAYTSGSFSGNLPDLCEPGFGPAIMPYMLDNQRLPGDFFEVTSRCNHKCHQCNYCADALENALIHMDGVSNMHHEK